MRNYYKIFKVRNDDIYFLKHGGKVVFDEWLKAKNGKVYDGSNKHYYEQGFHLFRSFNLAEKYLMRYKSIIDKTILTVNAKGISVKPTNKDVLLAKQIKVKQ